MALNQLPGSFVGAASDSKPPRMSITAIRAKTQRPQPRPNALTNRWFQLPQAEKGFVLLPRRWWWTVFRLG